MKLLASDKNAWDGRQRTAARGLATVAVGIGAGLLLATMVQTGHLYPTIVVLFIALATLSGLGGVRTD